MFHMQDGRRPAGYGNLGCEELSDRARDSQDG